MNRAEYLVRARELAPRGTTLPHTRLTPEAVRAIRNAARLREIARAAIAEQYGNAALARQYGVSVRAVERVLMRETHAGVT